MGEFVTNPRAINTLESLRTKVLNILQEKK